MAVGDARLHREDGRHQPRRLSHAGRDCRRRFSGSETRRAPLATNSATPAIMQAARLFGRRRQTTRQAPSTANTAIDQHQIAHVVDQQKPRPAGRRAVETPLQPHKGQRDRRQAQDQAGGVIAGAAARAREQRRRGSPAARARRARPRSRTSPVFPARRRRSGRSTPLRIRMLALASPCRTRACQSAAADQIGRERLHRIPIAIRRQETANPRRTRCPLRSAPAAACCSCRARTRAPSKRPAGLPADGLIFDLEDAVAPEAKEAARAAVAAAVNAGGYAPRELVLRVNPLDTVWGHADLASRRDLADRRRAAAQGRECRAGAADARPARRARRAAQACGVVHDRDAARGARRRRDRRRRARASARWCSAPPIWPTICMPARRATGCRC